MGRDLNDIHREDGAEAVRKIIADAQPPGGAGLVAVRASDVPPQKINWLWPDRIPRGKVIVLAGEGGLGKSLLLTWLAATVSRAALWPCLEGVAPRGSTIVLSAEDDMADTLIPRLLAAGADTDRVHMIRAVRSDDGKGNRTFNLQRDLALLEAKILELGDVALVEIDPVTSYLGQVDSHKNAELRAVLEPLGEMAARLGVAIVCNTHLSKSGGSANNRIIGSVAFVNHARAAFIVTADSEDDERRLFLPSKTNIGKMREGLAYRIATRFVGEDLDIPAPVIEWESETVKISADDAVAADKGDTSARDEAMEFLREVLADGPVPSETVKADAGAAGLAWATVRRAKDRLGVNVSRETQPGEFGTGKGRWVWSLKVLNSTQDAHVSEVSILSKIEHLKEIETCQRCSGEGCDWCRKPASRPAPASNGKATVEPPMDPDGLLPDIPDFLDRRPPR